MYSRLLVPIDGSRPSEVGLLEALRVAHEAQATVRFFHVVDLNFLTRGYDGTPFPEEVIDMVRRDGERLLEDAGERARRIGVSAETGSTEITSGRIADAILKERADCGADAIVMGTHGHRGFRRAMLGSDAEAVARESEVPVLLVPSRPH